MMACATVRRLVIELALPRIPPSPLVSANSRPSVPQWLRACYTGSVEFQPLLIGERDTLISSVLPITPAPGANAGLRHSTSNESTRVAGRL